MEDTRRVLLGETGRTWLGWRLLVAAAVSAGVCALLVACGSTTTTTFISPASRTVVPALCQRRTMLRVAPERWAAARAELAPAGARWVRLCRYSGLNAEPRLSLVSSRLIDDRALVSELLGELDRLPAPPSGGVACPDDDGSQIALILAYPDGQQVTITVGLTGCNMVTNGTAQRTALGVGSSSASRPQLIVQLERLVSGRPRSDPGSASVLARGRWSVRARSPLGTRYGPVFVWDGRELLELGGTAGGRLGGAPRDSGGAYDPADHRWRRVASAPSAVQPAGAASVWTGSEVFIFGRPTLPNETPTNVAGLYDPARNHWTVTSRAPVGPFIDQPSAVWTGEDVILAGFTNASHQHVQLQLASYDPATDTWSVLHPPISVAHPSLADAIVATDDGVLLWSLWGRTEKTGPNTYAGYSGVDVFRLSPSGAWGNVTRTWPQHHTVDTPIFTGTKVLVAPGQVWCGACSPPIPVGDYEHSYVVNPRTLHISPIPHGPLDNLGPQIIWTGGAEIAFNAGGEITGPGNSVFPGDIAIWNPSTRIWARGPRAPKQIDDAPAVWNGSQLYVLAHDGSLLAYGR
jgi:hypothetical protein